MWVHVFTYSGQGIVQRNRQLPPEVDELMADCSLRERNSRWVDGRLAGAYSVEANLKPNGHEKTKCKISALRSE